MKTQNLISVCHSATVLGQLELPAEKKFKVLKPHEARNLQSFCDIMSTHNCDISDFDGYYVGYSIGQIGKEFDLLRFGDDLILNIELKSELKVAKKNDKILKQMQTNYYYLKSLQREIRIFTYVENDGFYEYLAETDSIATVDAEDVSECIKNHRPNYSINPDNEFTPSNYLISPFNSTDRFIRKEYFLTSAQQKIKDEIQKELSSEPFMYFSVSANAGTGKTLLMYDIAREYISTGDKVVVIHCGALNEGHEKLRSTYGWTIHSIRAIQEVSAKHILDGCVLLFIDEAQRIRGKQLDLIIENSIINKIPIIFAYDKKQYLRSNEDRDIEEYLRANHANILLSPKRLTNKIRTNKEMASFIKNLFVVGSSRDHLNYECVTVEYMSNMDTLHKYMQFLRDTGWSTLTYTPSQYSIDPYTSLFALCEKTAHNVIGQEFPKVAFIMDSNFMYRNNKLAARDGYYSASGMLYQIVTRVVDNLKIVVYNNPDLYLKLLEIQFMRD